MSDSLFLAAGWGTWRAGDESWQTMIFTTLTLAQMAQALAVRSERVSFRAKGALTNPAHPGGRYPTTPRGGGRDPRG